MAKIDNLPEVSLRVSDDLTLVPVGPWIFASPTILKNLVDWRYRNRHAFFIPVPATVDSMSRYLQERPINNENRILFLARWRGGYVGHLGLASISTPFAELDNVIRGLPGYPGMMSDALHFLLQWAENSLGLGSLYLRVRDTNIKAIQLYSRSGFEPRNPDNYSTLYIKNHQAMRPGELLMVREGKDWPRPGS